MKNSDDTIWDRTNDLPICSTALYPLCHRGPSSNKHIKKICAPSWFYLQDSCTQFDENSADVLTVIAFAVSAADDWQYQNTAGYFIVAGHAQEGQP